MGALTIAVLPAIARPMIEGRLPASVEAHWWEDGDQLVKLAPMAEIGWFDMFDKTAPMEALRRAAGLKWLNSAFAGVDWMPLDDLQGRGVRITNGSGLNANAVAEFAVMSMLATARNFAEIVRAQDRHDWLKTPPATGTLMGAKVLVMGFGAIGQAVARMLAGFGAEVVPMRRSGGEGILLPGQWRARVGEFDWVVLCMPGTPETAGLIDAQVFSAMKDSAVIVNVARADIIDQQALSASLHAGEIGGAILDLTDPEPLPPQHPLWDAPNCHITMHLAAMPTPDSFIAAADRFIANCESWAGNKPLVAEVDLALGY